MPVDNSRGVCTSKRGECGSAVATRDSRISPSVENSNSCMPTVRLLFNVDIEKMTDATYLDPMVRKDKARGDDAICDFMDDTSIGRSQEFTMESMDTPLSR